MKISLLFSVLSVCILICIASSVHADIGWTEHTIRTGYAMPWSVHVIDLDDDGDQDVIGSARLGNYITWWENDGTEFFTEHTIDDTANGAMHLYAADFDYDGDIDITCALQFLNQIAWWENDGSENFTKHVIGVWDNVTYTYAEDVNSDGYIDILAAACEADPGMMGWFENDGAGNFTEHVVIAAWDNVNCVHAADVNSDDHMDLLGSASQAHEVAWFQNDGNENFTKINIVENWGRPSSVFGVDLDQDTDTDVIVTTCYPLNQIVWFENDGTQGFTQHTIGAGLFRPHCALPEDMDDDDDLDVVGAIIDNDEISWWENNGSQYFTKHVITNSFDGASDIYIEDLDDDGDFDIVGAAQFGNRIAWWESDFTGIAEYEDPLEHNNRTGTTIYAHPSFLPNDGTHVYYNTAGKQVAQKDISSGVYFVVRQDKEVQKIIIMQ
ncbi:MAG: VCBS repeat-containing protein [candidate division WOR-3 bacterium]|nr:MAG: VCBS repeat-containing protein [candidate division WOR-3 bacterium]